MLVYYAAIVAVIIMIAVSFRMKRTISQGLSYYQFLANDANPEKMLRSTIISCYFDEVSNV
jgi:hypothetical protein